MTFEKRIILDTCAILWLASGNSRLSKEALDTIEHTTTAFISPISAWEISLKTANGALHLPLSPEEWFNKAIKQHNLTFSSLDTEILFAANRLPWHHRDPADRFIIATAIRENACIITADPIFRKYGVKTIC
jgi:PIN domain nuclease of toxin-antitoxin system